MIIGSEKRLQILKDLDNIYNVLCAEDMDGAFRTNYIMHQLDDLCWIIDPKGRGRKRLNRYFGSMPGDRAWRKYANKKHKKEMEK